MFIDHEYKCLLVNNRRALADTDNRGKLNLAEFHVAMGLIYRSKTSTSPNCGSLRHRRYRTQWK